MTANKTCPHCGGPLDRNLALDDYFASTGKTAYRCLKCMRDNRPPEKDGKAAHAFKRTPLPLSALVGYSIFLE